MIRADNITVDTDEGRYVLIIHTEDGDKLSVDIHSIAIEFYDTVRHEIGPYVFEAERARATMPSNIVRAGDRVFLDEDTGYDLSDPKHPTFHERMVD